MHREWNQESDEPFVDCPPMTRAALRALRTASGLQPSCHYVVTDYNRGNVGAAEILLHAVDESTLSMTAKVKTTFDTLSWEGRYDIDANRLVELSDNIGNVVNGDNSVDGFPWGVASVNENRVNEGVINYTAGTITENEINGATLTLVAGSSTRNTLEHSANLIINDGSLAESTLAEDANVTINSGSNYENHFGTSCLFNQVGTGIVRYTQIGAQGTTTLGDVNLQNCTIGANTILNTTGSVGNISNSTFGYSITSALQNIPSLTINQSSFDSASQIAATGATRLYLYRSSGQSGGRYLVSANASMDCSYCNVDSYGYIQTTLGTFVANYANATSLGYISHQSTGSNRVDRCSAESQANIRFLNSCTGGRIYHCKSTSGATIYQNGTSTNCYHYYCNADSFAQIYIQNGVDARHYYNNAESYSYVRTYGTNTGQSIMYYCSASARGYVEHNGIANRIRFYSVRAEGQSIARQTGSSANANLYYCSFHAYYYFLGVLTGGTRSALHGYGRQNFTGMPATNGTATRNF